MTLAGAGSLAVFRDGRLLEEATTDSETTAGTDAIAALGVRVFFGDEMISTSMEVESGSGCDARALLLLALGFGAWGRGAAGTSMLVSGSSKLKAIIPSIKAGVKVEIKFCRTGSFSAVTTVLSSSSIGSAAF